MRPLTRDQKLKLARIRWLRSEGMTWAEIAESESITTKQNVQQMYQRLEYREMKTTQIESPTPRTCCICGGRIDGIYAEYFTGGHREFGHVGACERPEPDSTGNAKEISHVDR